MSYLRGVTPVYYDANGNIIQSAPCGSIYSFDVPGYSQVWLTQKKNGAVIFDGPFAVPMPAYQSGCYNDPGQYVTLAYTTDGNTKGSLIGTTVFTVTATPISPNAPAAGGIVGAPATDNTTLYLAGAGIAAVLLLSRQGKG